MRSATLPFVVAQFADNCAAVWHDRERAARSEAFLATFDDLRALDDRVEAQLDGLAVSGDEGWAATEAALAHAGAGELFTSAALALRFASHSDRPLKRFDTVMDAVLQPARAVRPLACALYWTDGAVREAALRRLSRRSDPLARSVVITAAAMSGTDPGPFLLQALESEHGYLVAAACEAGLHRSARDVTALEEHLGAPDTELRLLAATAASVGQSKRARHVLKELTSNRNPELAERAASALFRAIEPRDAVVAYRELFGHQTTRASLRAAAAAGVCELVPVLLDALQCTSLTRLAGDAFTVITGAQALAVNATAGVAADEWPSDDPADEAVALHPDIGLPWPDARSYATWWREHAGQFNASTRYIDGAADTDVALRQLIRGGLQRTRAAAAGLLAMRGGGYLDVCSPAFRQHERLAGEQAWA